VASHHPSSDLSAGLDGRMRSSIPSKSAYWCGFHVPPGYLFFIETERLGVRSSELAMGAGFVFLAVLPIGPLSWLAVTALSLYIIISTNVASSRRGAFILLATTVPMLWSRLLFQFFCQPNIADRRVTCWLDIGHSSDRGHG